MSCLILISKIPKFISEIGELTNEILYPTLIVLLFLMIVDYISGMLASKKEALEHPNDENYGWSSKKSIIGIYKKLGYIIAICVAVSTDFIIRKYFQELNYTYEYDTAFGTLVAIWFVLNELLSITENAGRMGAPLPAFLKKILSQLKDNIDENKNDS